MKYMLIIVTITTHCVGGFNFFGFKHVEEIGSLRALNTEAVKTKWIEQRLDNFDDNENRTWKMRYFERLDFWEENGPIYFYINGEWKAQPSRLATGIVYELGKETNGAMFASEHRYYGDIKPLNGTSPEQLKYLSSRQALADIAVLLRKIKSKSEFLDSKVVVIGGSYAGNLAAWMKLLYPDLVDVALASSAPVLAKKDFYEYLEVVSNDFKKFGKSTCLNDIVKKIKRYDNLLESSAGIEQLKAEENICHFTNMSKVENKQLFIMAQVEEFQISCQYGSPDSVKNDCDKLTSTNENNNSSNESAFWADESNCYDYDLDNVITQLRDENDDSLMWTYQSCTEFGYFQTTVSDSQPFGKNVPLDVFISICKLAFGSDYDEKRIDEGIKKTNDLYGGLLPNVSRVVFVNGEMDPWSALGILKDLSNDTASILIPKSSHCADLRSNRKNDLEELKTARKNIKDLIKEWIDMED